VDTGLFRKSIMAFISVPGVLTGRFPRSEFSAVGTDGRLDQDRVFLLDTCGQIFNNNCDIVREFPVSSVRFLTSFRPSVTSSVDFSMAQFLSQSIFGFLPR
jgi:hypothetical protein